MLKASTCPEADPKLTKLPRGRRQSSEAGKVAFPTPSYTAWHPCPLVISLTRATKSSSR